jgi:hypothetical protein
MQTTHRWLRATLLLSLTVALALSASARQSQGPLNDSVVQDNLKGLFTPNDDGTKGAGEKDSMFRKQLGRVILRGDLKIVPSFTPDAKHKGNDDLAIDLSANGVAKDGEDAKKDDGPAIDVIVGGAMDVDLGVVFEALSIEYKKDLLEKAESETDAEKAAKAKESAFVRLLSDDDLTVKIAGFTVRCGGQSDPTGMLGKDSLSNGGLLKNGLKIQFWAGCVPIIVRGNAGLNLGLAVGPVIDVPNSSFGVELEPAMYVHGWLSAGIGGAVGPLSISAGIAGKLRLLDATLQVEGGICLAPNASSPVYGSIVTTVQAVKVDLQLFAQVQATRFLSRTFTWTIYTFKFGQLREQIGMRPRDPDFFPAAPMENPPPVEPPKPGRTQQVEKPVRSVEPR